MNIIEAAKGVVNDIIGDYLIYLENGECVEINSWGIEDLEESWLYEYEDYCDSPDCIVKIERRPDDPWLTKRKKELSHLKFNYCDLSEVSDEMCQKLQQLGYYCYSLRDWDSGVGFNIENGKVVVNHIGYWATDLDLSPYMNDGYWIGIDELSECQVGELIIDI